MRKTLLHRKIQSLTIFGPSHERKCLKQAHEFTSSKEFYQLDMKPHPNVPADISAECCGTLS